jgi:hypothetical protein
MQVALHLSVPYLISALKVRFDLKFNLNPADAVFPASEYYGALVDPGRSPDSAKREMIRHGISFITSLGGNAAGLVHTMLADDG